MNQKELFWLSVTVFLTVLAWMLLDIYKLNTGAKLDSVVSSSVSVNFKINTDLLEVVKKRVP